MRISAMRAVGLLSIALLAGGLAAACSSSGSKGGPIEGRDWRVLAMADDLGDLKPAPLTVPLEARFENGVVGGRTGCNTYAGSYVLAGEKLTIGDVSSTLMGCDEWANTASALFMKLLAQATTYSVEGFELAIFDASGRQILGLQDEAASGG